MDYVVRLEQLNSLPLAVVRRRAALHELSKVVPDACGAVWDALRSQRITGAGRHVAVYLDDQINLEVGVELDAPFVGSGEVVGSGTPAGLVATTTHYGPYGRLNEAHQAIRRWCENNGHALAGPNWEIYGHWKEEWNSATRDQEFLHRDPLPVSLRTGIRPPDLRPLSGTGPPRRLPVATSGPNSAWPVSPSSWRRGRTGADMAETVVDGASRHRWYARPVLLSSPT